MGIVEEMRGYEVDHMPDGWPAVRMRQVSALCDEIDRLRAENKHWFDQCHGLRARLEAAPVAIMDTRDVLGICAPTEDDFQALYALQGKRVRLVIADEAPNVAVTGLAPEKG